MSRCVRLRGWSWLWVRSLALRRKNCKSCSTACAFWWRRSRDKRQERFSIKERIVWPLAISRTGAGSIVSPSTALSHCTLPAGAKRVTGIDISADAIAIAQRNAELNDINNAEFREANVFDALRELEQGGERFDTIVLDPPAFAKNRASVKAAARGYKEINLRALKLLNPGGVLVTCTCSYHMSEEMFLELLAAAANDAHRRVQIVEKRTQASDHPILLGMPETYYLKCLIARVVE